MVNDDQTDDAGVEEAAAGVAPDAADHSRQDEGHEQHDGQVVLVLPAMMTLLAGVNARASMETYRTRGLFDRSLMSATPILRRGFKSIQPMCE